MPDYAITGAAARVLGPDEFALMVAAYVRCHFGERVTGFAVTRHGGRLGLRVEVERPVEKKAGEADAR